eukprot:1458887-Amphidinium_carterae.2
MDIGKMNHLDYFGNTYYLVAGIRIRLDDGSSALLPWFSPLSNTMQVTVADAVFHVVNQISQ